MRLVRHGTMSENTPYFLKISIPEIELGFDCRMKAHSKCVRTDDILLLYLRIALVQIALVSQMNRK